MHAYDPVRHTWRYDIGGFAWDNTELASNMWLWYNFLRTGREDIWRMAEAMTRHTAEVDVYHIGPNAGLGTGITSAIGDVVPKKLGSARLHGTVSIIISLPMNVAVT